jgi:hypothetical protein
MMNVAVGTRGGKEPRPPHFIQTRTRGASPVESQYDSWWKCRKARGCQISKNSGICHSPLAIEFVECFLLRCICKCICTCTISGHCSLGDME